jgi:hypothetical protein
MNQMIEDIIEGNKSIALMMDWKYIPWHKKEEMSKDLGIPVHSGGWYKPRVGFKKENWFKGRNHYDLGFHKNWNRIMEAIKFIEDNGFQVDFVTRLLPNGDGKDTHCIIWDDFHTKKVTEQVHLVKEHAVFLALRDFALAVAGVKTQEQV